MGSLFVMDALTPGERLPGNMFVPVDLLQADARRDGAHRRGRRARGGPWLGVNSLEEDGRVKVLQVNDESPADKAGIVAGDIILSVDGAAGASRSRISTSTLWTRGARRRERGAARCCTARRRAT